MPVSRVEITVVGKVRTHVAPWVRVRRSVLDRDDDIVTRDDGLRLASPLRTLFTLAIDFNAYRFDRAAEDLWHLGLVTPDEAGSTSQPFAAPVVPACGASRTGWPRCRSDRRRVSPISSWT